jgi:hypothetical protein
MVQAKLSKKEDPMSKITRAKRAGGVTEEVEHLPSKQKAPSSSLSTAKNFLRCRYMLFHF